MKTEPQKAQDPSNAPERRTWETPRIESSDVFTRAALTCCTNEFFEIIGSVESTGAC